MTRFRSLRRATILFLSFLSVTTITTYPSYAAPSTKDSSIIKKTAQQLAKLNSQLTDMRQILTLEQSVVQINSQINEIVGTVGSMIGEFNGLTIGSLLNEMDMGLQNIASNKIESILSQTSQNSNLQNYFNKGLTSLPPYLQIMAIQNANRIPSVTNGGTHTNAMISNMNKMLDGSDAISDASSSISSTLYTTTNNPTAAQLYDVNEMRRAYLQTSITTGLAQASAVIQTETTDGPKILEKMEKLVKKQGSKRGNIKLTTTLSLKEADEIRTNNAMLAKLIQLRSAWYIAHSAERPTGENK